MSTINVTAADLHALAERARGIGTLEAFTDVALQWAGLAEKEIERLTANTKKANDQAEHFEREWYLRGDEIERLTAERDELRRQLAEAEQRADDDAWGAAEEIDMRASDE